MKHKLLFTIPILLVVGMTVVQIVVSHKLSTAGIELSSMQNERTDLSFENEKLRQKIASESSLLIITKKAQNLGFEKANFVYLDNPPVALR